MIFMILIFLILKRQFYQIWTQSQLNFVDISADFIFVKYYFYFLIQTPGIGMAILSVYQRSIDISNE